MTLPKPKYLWMATGLWSAFVGLCLLLRFFGSALERQAPRERILVPQGYRGWLVLQWGLPTAAPLPLVGGKYEVRFPGSGWLKVSDQTEHRSSSMPVSYWYDGDRTWPLKYNDFNDDAGMTDTCSPTEVCLRHEGFAGDNYETLFVGTADEAQKMPEPSFPY